MPSLKKPVRLGKKRSGSKKAKPISDEHLDKARYHMEFCYRHFDKVIPGSAMGRATDLRISTERLTSDDFITKLINTIDVPSQWNEQFKELLFRTMGAQATYIRLLERRIGR